MTDRTRVRVSWTCLYACLAACSASAQTLTPPTEGRRLALVIGINQYVQLPPLVKGVTDAYNVGKALREKGKFTVTEVLDPESFTQLKSSLDAFVDTVKPGDAVVVYYAGHGIQSGGKNYLVPSDFPRDETKLAERALTADALLQAIGKRSPAMKLLILDACRNNPLGGGAGLAAMELGQFGPGTRVEFAAEAGKTAQDGAFARHFVTELARPGLELNEVFQNVRKEIVAQGGSTLSLNQLTINFYFIPAARPSADAALANLQRAADLLPTGDMGQVSAAEVLVREGRSFAGLDLLSGLPLQKAVLDGGDFTRARLTGANLTEANFRSARLDRTSLRFAELTGAQFSSAELRGASLPFADANGGVFDKIEGADSDWFATRLQKASFRGATLSQANFMFADLRNAVFDGAVLTNTFFIGSDLTGASFVGATFQNTDFSGAIMDGVALTPKQIAGACETPAPPMVGGWYGYSFPITVMEIIPNTSREGGNEYSRFLQTPTAYLLHPNAFPPCKPRPLQEDLWYPIWKVKGTEHLRSESTFSFSRRFLNQAGRRDSIRRRVTTHFEWLQTIQRGGK